MKLRLIQLLSLRNGLLRRSLLALLFSLCCSNLSAEYYSFYCVVDSIKYGIFAEGFDMYHAVALSNLHDKGYVGDITIPNKVTFTDYKSEEVTTATTKIAAGLFNGYKGVKSITLPSTINELGDSAFANCSGLMSFSIPSSVYVIGDGAFSGCTGLTSIEIPSSVYVIGDGAFSGCTGLTSVEIPSSVTTIRDGAFSGCTGLTFVEIPSSVTTIRDGAFSGCTGLTSVEIPSSVTTIGDGAFSGCTGLTSVEIPSNVTTIGDGAFSGCTGLASVEIPSNVTTIGDGAFSGCTGLASVLIPSCLKSFNGTFPDCPNVQTVILNDGAEMVNDSLFYGCSNLRSITIPESVTSIGKYSFFGCSSLSSITLPSAIKTLGDYAFANCSGLTSISIPDSVTSIGNYSFCCCSSLSSITLPSAIKTLGDYAFANCSGLTSLAIPASVTSIRDGAFSGCTGLTSVAIPSCVYSFQRTFPDSPNIRTAILSDGADKVYAGLFKDCSNLTSVILPASVRHIGDSWGWGVETVEAFSGCTGLVSVTIPSCVSSLKETFPDSPDIQTVILSDGVERVNKELFENCSNLTSVILPKSVSSIGDCSFYKCTSLSSIAFPGNLSSIGYAAFYGCSALTSVDFANVSSIGSSAFHGCSALTSVDLAGVSSIGASAFSSTGLKSIFIPATINNIPSFAFYGCKDLCSVSFSRAAIVTTIGNYAFSGCAMTSVKVPSTVTSLGSYAFANCANLAKAEFLSDVEVPFSTFENDDKLKEIISPSCYYDGLALYNKDKTTLFGVYNKSFTNDYIILETTTTIGDNAFGNCTGSATVTLPTSSLVKVGARAFCGCAKMRIKNLPETVKTIGDEAFYECKYLPASLTMSNAGIGNRAFQRTEGLATVSLSNATVGSNAFANSSLKSVSASDSLKIDNFAFAGCEELETLTLGNGVRNFAGGGIFSGCTSLRSVDGFNAADVPYNTFAGCSSLIYLQDTHMKTIGSRAFYNCKSLKGLYVDANQITSIGVEAFSGCEAFSSPWEFNNVDAVIGDGAFTGCENLNKFRFAGTANISDAASFADNTTIYVPKGTGEHYQALLPKCTIVEDYDASDLSLFYDDYNVPDYMPLVADKGSWVGDNVLTDVSQLSANYADEYEGSLANLLKDGRNYFLSGIDTENPQESPHYIQMDMKKGYKSFKIKMTRPSGMEDFAPVKVRILTSNSPEDESSWCDLGLDTLVYTNDTAVVNIDHYDKMRYVRMQVEATALNKKENGNLYFALSTLNLTPYQGQELKWDDGADWYHKNSSKLFLQGKNPIPAWYDRPDYLRSISLKTRIKKAVIIITKKSSISQTSWENTFYVPDGNFRSAERFAFRASSNSSTYEYVDTFKIDYKYRNDTIGCYCASFEEPISRFSLYCADSLTKGRYGYYFNEAYVIGNFHIYDRPRKMELLSNTERNEIQSIKDKVGKEQFLREADYRTLASYGAKMDALAQTGRWVDFINYDYCTFYADYPAVLPDSIKAGIVKEQNGELVVDYIYGAGSVIPANTGVIIKGNCRGNAYVFEEGTTDATSPEENLLHGTVVDEETYVDGCDRYYMLSFDKESDSRLGFYWNDADGPKPFVNKAYKAYLALPANVHAAKMNGFALDELEKGVAIGDITDIVNASHDGKRPNKGIYSIDGRQINASTTNNLPAGVYIVNGKKVMVK